MSEIKKPKQITVTVGGKDYVLQHPGVRKAIEINDFSRTDSGRYISGKLYPELMNHVIVNPKTDWEYWEEEDNFEFLDEVMAEATTFLNARKGRSELLQEEGRE